MHFLALSVYYLMNPHCHLVKKVLSISLMGKLLPQITHPENNPGHEALRDLPHTSQPHYFLFSGPSHEVTDKSSCEKGQPAHRVLSTVALKLHRTRFKFWLHHLLLLAVRTWTSYVMPGVSVSSLQKPHSLSGCED